MRHDLRLPTRSNTYLVVVGAVLGMLFTGLVVPFAFGTRQVAVSTGGSFSGGPSDDPGLLGDAGPGATTDDGSSTGTTGGVAVGPGGTGTTGGAGPGAGGPGTGGPQGPGGTGTTVPTTLRATDRGVTADSIKIGVLIGDVAGAGVVGADLSSFSVEAERAAWQAFIDDVNERGGILGRKITPVYRVFRLLQPGAAEAACRYLTQDQKVFAVFNFGFFTGPPILCVTEQNRTPLVKGNSEAGDEYFKRSRGYMSSAVSSYDRIARNLGSEAHNAGLLTGKKIGLVARQSEASFTQSAEQGLIEAGYSVAHTSLLSDDPSIAQSQMRAEVSSMNTKGVDVVFLMTVFVYHAQFAQTAEADGFRPQYVVSDIFGSSLDVAGQSMPDSYDGAVAFTGMRAGEWRRNLPEPAPDKACRELYERKTGATVAQSADDLRFTVSLVCEVVQRFEAASKAVGANLTRDALAAAIAGLGERPTPYLGGGSYRPGKTDASDYFRIKVWRNACRCYEITRVEFRKGRY